MTVVLRTVWIAPADADQQRLRQAFVSLPDQVELRSSVTFDSPICVSCLDDSPTCPLFRPSHPTKEQLASVCKLFNQLRIPRRPDKTVNEGLIRRLLRCWIRKFFGGQLSETYLYGTLTRKLRMPTNVGGRADVQTLAGVPLPEAWIVAGFMSGKLI